MPNAADLAKIHIAKKQLAMDDDAYRAMLKSVAGVESAKSLSLSGVSKVLAHLKRCGFKPIAKKQSRPLADDAQSRKIRALWLELHQSGAVRNPAESALAQFVKRQTGVAALQWLTVEQASAVIEDLKQWQKRLDSK